MPKKIGIKMIILIVGIYSKTLSSMAHTICEKRISKKKIISTQGKKLIKRRKRLDLLVYIGSLFEKERVT